MDQLTAIHPKGWAKPKGYVPGVFAPGNHRTVYVSGMIAWDEDQKLVGAGDFAAQFRQALQNVVKVVKTAGGGRKDLASMRVYVTDKRQYLAAREALGEIWRDVVGKKYPAMTLVQVADLLEDGALVEIEATAAIQPSGRYD